MAADYLHDLDQAVAELLALRRKELLADVH